MSLSTSDLEKYANNPSRIINEIVSNLEDAYEEKGCKLNSTEHPFSYMVDISVGGGYLLLNQMQDTLYKLYPLHAQTFGQLSRHLSDTDWYDMFGTPGTMDITFVMDMDDLEEYAIEYSYYDNNTKFSYKKLIIPKDTMVSINDIIFTLMNGVEIRLYEYGNVSVVYDSSTNNPLTPIGSNILDYDIIYYKGTKKLKIVIPCYQLECAVKWKLPITKLGGFKQLINYDDELYAIRAILTRSTDMIEMNVTYTDNVFDQLYPTLVVDYDQTNKQLTCVVPEVYLNNESAIGTVDIYVYTTKGEFNTNLKTNDKQNNKVGYKDYRYGKKELGKYSNNINKLNNALWLVTESGYVVGGKNARTFTEIRHKVIYGNRQGTTPITMDQLTEEFLEDGWSVLLSEDFITGRLFKVSADLPVQSNKGFNSGCGTHVVDLNYSIEQLVETGMCYDNSTRVTLKPNSLISIKDGCTLLNKSEYDDLMASDIDTKASVINNNNLVFNPYYYVLDTSNETVSIRGYHLDDPSISMPTFVYENPDLGMSLGVANIYTNVLNDGYEILLTTTSNDEYKNTDDNLLGCQLSFYTPEATELASIKGELYGKTKEGERVYRFHLQSNFDIDSNNHFYVNNAYQYNALQSKTAMELSTEISLFFIKMGSSRPTNSDSDLKIDSTIYGDTATCILETTYGLTLGKNLNRLYTRVRPILGEAQYEVYEDNVYALYESDEYKRGEDGKLLFDENGKLDVLHRSGEIMEDNKGNPIVRYPKNSVKYDSLGEPIMKAPRYLKYYFDIIGLDAAYLLSNDDYDIEFLNETKSYLHDYITAKLDYYNNLALEKTSLIFQPKDTLGESSVIINSNYTLTMSKVLSFNVIFYVLKEIMQNSDFKEVVEQATPTIINNVLNTGVVSRDNVANELKAISPDNLLSVKVVITTEEGDIEIMSNKDDDTGFSIKKILRTSSDGLLSINEDIEFNWRVHKE